MGITVEHFALNQEDIKQKVLEEVLKFQRNVHISIPVITASYSVPIATKVNI